MPENSQFDQLAAYANFLLQNRLADFAQAGIEYSREEKLPLLQFFEKLSPDAMLAMAMDSSRELLSYIANHQIDEYISNASANFIENRLPTLEREQVVSLDIPMVNFVRRKSFLKFLKSYTTDVDRMLMIMDELARFLMLSESSAVSAFLQIQHEKIARINAELQQQRKDLLELQELADMGSFAWDLERDTSVLTPGVNKILEFEGHLGLNGFLKGVHPDDRKNVQEAIERAMKKDGIFDCEYRYLANGKEKKIWSRGVITYAGKKPTHMKGTIMDITTTSTLLEQLQQSENLHKQAQALTHIGNWSWDVETGKISWSDEMYRIYGLEPQAETITFERFLSFVHPADREKRLAEIQRSLQTHEADDYMLRIINPDGSEKMLKGKGQVITGADNKVTKLVGTCQDITKEYFLNRELEEKERYLQQLIQNAPDAVIVIDQEGLVTLWNPKAETIFGWRTGEVMGRSLSETIIPPEYREAHARGMRRLLDTGEARVLNQNLELTALTQSGQVLDISLRISESFQAGSKIFIAFLRDITDQKKIQHELKKKTQELQTLNESLAHQNRELEIINKELESFNYVASHDLKEPLRKIQVFASRVLESKQSLPGAPVSYVEKILVASSGLQALIDDLLIYSQASATSSKELVDLNQVIEQAKADLAAAIEEKNVGLLWGDLPVVEGIPFQMYQLFVNLLSNAIKYGRENIQPKITITSSIVHRGDVPGSTPMADKYYQLQFRDNGIGFRQENAEKIFGLFQRLHTRERYSGTGIGLAICKKIVQNHRGHITAKSKPNEGALFTVYLPVPNPTVH